MTKQYLTEIEYEKNGSKWIETFIIKSNAEFLKADSIIKNHFNKLFENYKLQDIRIYAINEIPHITITG